MSNNNLPEWAISAFEQAGVSTDGCADVQMALVSLEKSLQITNPTEITLAKIDDTEDRYQQTENNN